MTKLRWVLLLALAVVAAAALRLSAEPIIKGAATLGVPDDGSRQTAVVMIEGAVLILTALWLHPATTSPVRKMAAAGAVACLLLSAGAGFAEYGPLGIVPALLYAGLVHILSRDLLSGADTLSHESAETDTDTLVTEAPMATDRPRISAGGWGPPDTACRTPEPDRTAPDDTPRPLRAVSPHRSPAATAVAGWHPDMAVVDRGAMSSRQWLRARARALEVVQAGKSDTDLRRDVEVAEVARRGVGVPA